MHSWKPGWTPALLRPKPNLQVSVFIYFFNNKKKKRITHFLISTRDNCKCSLTVKISPVKQSQLRNFLSKGQMPPVRSTAPGILLKLNLVYWQELCGYVNITIMQLFHSYCWSQCSLSVSSSQPVSLSLPFTQILRGLGWCKLYVLPVPVPGASPSWLGAGGGGTTARTPSPYCHSSSTVHPPPPHSCKDPVYPARLRCHPVHPFNKNSLSARNGLWTQPYCQPWWVNHINSC